MNLQDWLNIVGIAVTALGSTVAIIGVLFQMNAYLPKGLVRTAVHAWYVLLALARGGGDLANRTLLIESKLERAAENRGKTIAGLVLLLAGFVLQMAGSALLIAAVLHPSRS